MYCTMQNTTLTNTAEMIKTNCIFKYSPQKGANRYEEFQESLASLYTNFSQKASIKFEGVIVPLSSTLITALTPI